MEKRKNRLRDYKEISKRLKQYTFTDLDVMHHELIPMEDDASNDLEFDHIEKVRLLIRCEMERRLNDLLFITDTQKQDKKADDVQAVWDYLEAKRLEHEIGGKLKLTYERKTKIRQRLKSHTAEELMVMIAHKAKEWSGVDKMRKHIHPDTLFRPSNCTKYVEQSQTKTIKDDEPKGWLE